MPFALAIHGGAGLIRRASLTPEREAGCVASLHHVVELGRMMLERGASAVDVVEACVVALEEDPLFNAGRGAVLTSEGTVELDAAVMDGRTRAAGAVTNVGTVRNPVRLARLVMERTPHVMFAGAGAEALAREAGLELVEPAFFVVPERLEQLEQARRQGVFHLDHGGAKKDVYGTVGAVACDRDGHVAAATSTGGMVNKRPGRVGDTPIIGAGTFAWDHTCAASGTGHGEPFVRLGACARVSAWMELGGLDLHAAAERVVREDLPALSGQGGIIAVDAQGNVAMPFNTAGMFRGAVREGEAVEVAIW